MVQKYEQRERRHKRIRAKIRGTAARPRVAVFRSNRFVWAQCIDDDAGQTLVSVSTKGVKGKTPVERARAAGAALAALSREKGITRAAFDRSGFVFAGAVRALAEGAREGGLAF